VNGTSTTGSTTSTGTTGSTATSGTTGEHIIIFSVQPSPIVLTKGQATIQVIGDYFNSAYRYECEVSQEGFQAKVIIHKLWSVLLSLMMSINLEALLQRVLIWL